MKQYEYRTLKIEIKGTLTKKIEDEDMELHFRQLGMEGFALQAAVPVSFNGHTQSILYTFMRER